MAEYIILDEFLSEEAKESADAQGHLHKLVRCKDCKHRWERVAEHGVRFMRSDGKCPFEAIKRDDYYCADAEPKDGEQE